MKTTNIPSRKIVTPRDLASPTNEHNDELAEALSLEPKEIPAAIDLVKNDFAQEQLLHNKQRRRHKSIVFYFSLVVCVILFVSFGWLVSCSDRLPLLIATEPFSIALISLMGAVPTVLLLVIFKSIFHMPAPTDSLDKKDFEMFKEMANFVKSLLP